MPRSTLLLIAMTILGASCVSAPDKTPTSQNARQATCEYAVVRDESAAGSVRSYYPDAVVTNIGAAESLGLMLSFPDMLEDYIASHSGDLREMAQLFKEGRYRIQIVPFTEGGRRLVHLHLMSLDIATQDWDKHYSSINDGGEHNCFCIIDLNTRQILLAHCSGYG
ncbi:MAG: hypothetical protein Q8M07_12260 [Prosthecobacter sp.]|nr:hypothetical protein [Prosthecobacter sp.]